MKPNVNVEQDAMMELQALRQKLATQAKPTAEQGLKLSEPAEGQLHRLRSVGEMPEAFALVTKIKGGNCAVIPGSFDAMEGGPDDLVLPRSVLGDYVTLAMDLARNVSTQALGTGFARLDEESFRNVCESLAEFQGTKGARQMYPYALPYIGRDDERIAYHAQLKERVRESQTQALLEQFASWVLLAPQQGVALAAGGETAMVRMEFIARDGHLSLTMDLDPAQKRCYVSVYGGDGEESHAADGWQLHLAADRTSLGTIADGGLACDVPEMIGDRLYFTDAEGEIQPGEWRRR
jgi:hypothetical protein